MNLKAIVFDCDGVIFDSREANKAYYNAILKSIGLPPMNEEQLNFAHSHTVFEVIDYLVPNPSLREKAYFARKDINYSQFLCYMRPEPYVSEILKIFKQNFKTGMATNRTDTIHNLLKQYKLDKYFDIVISAFDVQNVKPHPEALFKIMHNFSISPNQMLYIGDTQIDAEMAQNAHVPFVSYKNPDLTADFYVKNFLDLAQIIGIKVT